MAIQILHFFLALHQFLMIYSIEVNTHSLLSDSVLAVSRVLMTNNQEAIVVTDVGSFIVYSDGTLSQFPFSLKLLSTLTYDKPAIVTRLNNEYVVGCTLEGLMVQFTTDEIIHKVGDSPDDILYCYLIKVNDNKMILLYSDSNSFNYIEEYSFNEDNKIEKKGETQTIYQNEIIYNCEYISYFNVVGCLIYDVTQFSFALSFDYGLTSIPFPGEEAVFRYLYDDLVLLVYQSGSLYYMETIRISKNDADSSYSSITEYSQSFSGISSMLQISDITMLNENTILLYYYNRGKGYCFKYYINIGIIYSQTFIILDKILVLGRNRLAIFNDGYYGFLMNGNNTNNIYLGYVSYPICSNFKESVYSVLSTGIDFNQYINESGLALVIISVDSGITMIDSSKIKVSDNTTYSTFTFTVSTNSFSSFFIYFAYYYVETFTEDLKTISSYYSTNVCKGEIIFTCNDEGELYKPLSYYTKNNEDKSTCVSVCDNNWFINSSGDFICTSSSNSCSNSNDFNDNLPYLYGNHCVAQCPIEAPFSYEISSDLSQCLSECPSNAPFLYNSQLCVSSCQTYNQISYHNICDDECPNGDLYVIDISSNSCKLNLGPVSIEDLIDNIDQSILNLYEDVDIVMTESFILGIYNTSKEDTELMKELSEQNGLSLIDLGSCEDILKKQYSIPDEEPLIIVKIELERENEKTNQLEYAVYSLSGEKLNLEYCNKANIVIISNIKNTEGMDIDLAIELAELGIDIYDSQDDFFNDLCYSFTSSSKTDVILNDRKTDYFRNISFCEENCEYSGIDLENKKVNCTCEAKTDILSKETVKTFAKQFKNTLSNSNFKVIKCIGKAFSIDIFTNNVGNYFMLFMILCNTSCLLFYIIYGIDNLKKTMYLSLFGNNISNPPNRSDEDATCDVSPGISKCKTTNGHFSSTNFIILMKPTLRKKGTYNMVEKNTSLTNSAEFKSNHDLTDIHNETSSISLSPKYDKYEINYIKYEEAVKYDKRTKMSMFLSILVLKHPLIYAFFINDKYTIKSISISMFIISEQMGLAFNALFYTDGYISNQYKHEGNIDIIASLPKSIYSSLFSIGLSIVFGFLTSSKSILMKILLFSDQKEKDDLNKVLRCIRIKLAFYFTLIFIFSIFFWYYVTAFCAVYQNSQVGWLIGAVISIALGLITPVAMSLFVFIFRVIGIEKKSRCSYKVSNFLL